MLLFEIRFYFFRVRSIFWVLSLFFISSCASLPDPKYTAFEFPEDAVFIDTKPAQKYKVLGPVRVRVRYSSLNAEREEQDLCKNYFNKGARDLLKRARRDLKADAVINVRSVVYYMDGKSKSFTTAECSDDGGEGQILMEGKAIRYFSKSKKSFSPSAP
ncbi:MAG: hypothetical protein H7301_04555 [Cryobacterium sp.]|nr:hypothetical protein [Oligoflexia bacterium]